METASACWCRTNVRSEWLFEKVANFWTRSNSPLRSACSFFQEHCCQSLDFVTCFEITGTIPSLQSGLFPSLWFGTYPQKLGRGEHCHFKFSHFLTIFVSFSKCVKCLPCVRKFYIMSFQQITVTSKWQLCWKEKGFVSFYSHNGWLCETQVCKIGSGRSGWEVKRKRELIFIEHQSQSSKGVFIFLLLGIMLQRITLK